MARQVIFLLLFIFSATAPAASEISDETAASIRILEARVSAAAAQHGDAAKKLPKKKLRDKEAIKKRLLFMMKVDQIIRNALTAHWKNPQQDKDYGEYVTDRFNKIDPPHTAELKRILNARRGKWFTISEVGDDGAKAAWLLVQHADRDPEFQAKALKAMRKLPKSEVNQVDLCYLTDRVRIKQKRTQECGTQIECLGGKPVVQGNPTIEQISLMDARREELGLALLEEYMQGFSKHCKNKNAPENK